MFTRKLIAVAGAALLSMGSALAADFSAAIIPGINTISDDDAETILKFDQALNDGAGGYRTFIVGTDAVGVNDIFVGIVGITSFPTGALGSNPNSYNEVTAVYALQALTASATGAGGVGSCGGLASCTNYTFGAVTGGLNTGISLLNSVYGTTLSLFANADVNSFASIQEDTTVDFNRTSGTLDNAFQSAADGTQRFIWDLIAANGDVFYTTAPSNVAEIGTVAAGTGVGGFNGNGTVGYQNVPGWTFDPNMTFTGNIQRPGQADGPFGIWTDSTYTLFTPVPEPGTLALVGLALAGFGIGSSRRKA